MHQFYLGNGASSAREAVAAAAAAAMAMRHLISLSLNGERVRTGGRAGGRADICDMGEMWMETDRDHIKRHNWAGGNGDGED